MFFLQKRPYNGVSETAEYDTEKKYMLSTQICIEQGLHVCKSDTAYGFCYTAHNAFLNPAVSRDTGAMSLLCLSRP